MRFFVQQARRVEIVNSASIVELATVRLNPQAYPLPLSRMVRLQPMSNRLKQALIDWSIATLFGVAFAVAVFYHL
jgi:hypothetical protein